MEVYILIGSIVAVLAAIPFIRIFCKRLSMKRRITRACLAEGAVLHPAHRGWLLGRRMGKRCDFYIETPTTVYAVKLFASHKRSQYLIFTDDGCVYSRKFLNFINRYGTGPRYSKDSKPRKLPDYDFRFGYKDEWASKEFCPVLLLNPTSIEVHRNTVRKETIVSSGETVAGMTLHTLPSLLNELERSQSAQ